MHLVKGYFYEIPIVNLFLTNTPGSKIVMEMNLLVNIDFRQSVNFRPFWKPKSPSFGLLAVRNNSCVTISTIEFLLACFPEQQ